MNDILKQKIKKLKNKHGYDLSKYHELIDNHNLTDVELYDTLILYDLSESIMKDLNVFLTRSNKSGTYRSNFHSCYIICKILMKTMFSVIDQLIDNKEEKDFIIDKMYESFNNKGELS